jgi:hypothetical protein
MAGVAATPAVAGAQVTFTKDVAPILYRSCVRCHRPGDIARMSLLTYAEARPWARAIKDRVVKREMPPWFLDRKFNPDARNWVGDGGRTIDEMAFAWIGWYDLTEEEYKEKLAEPKAQEQRRKTSN